MYLIEVTLELPTIDCIESELHGLEDCRHHFTLSKLGRSADAPQDAICYTQGTLGENRSPAIMDREEKVGMYIIGAMGIM